MGEACYNITGLALKTVYYQHNLSIREEGSYPAKKVTREFKFFEDCEQLLAIYMVKSTLDI